MAYTSIDDPTLYFNTKLYTGNGSTNAITGVGFQPDWTICKARSYNDSHFVFDAVRGATKHLQTNSTSAEVTNANSLTAFGTDGFTLGSDGGANSNGDTYASWNWLASNTTASNTDGSITSTVSANTTSGFSIVTWTGTGANATVGHGLGVAPKMVIIKNRSDGYDWIIYNQNIGNTGFLRLNTTAAYDTGINMFQNTDSTSSFFSISSHGAVNTSGNNFIAYCFAEKKGYSKFGSYTGNGSTDGTFVYTGFKPAFLIRKRTDSAVAWYLHDNKRDGYNVTQKWFSPNDSDAESTTQVELRVDFLSNGFKMRDPNGAANASGGTYIYMAFASNPFVTSTGIPTTAR